jgi:hypothetical protein
MAKISEGEALRQHPEVLAGVLARLVWGSKRDEGTGCLVWQLGTSQGYPQVHALGRKWGGHRLRWSLDKGEIPAGHMVCHHCDNRACLEMSHLFLGTAVENQEDAATKGKQRHGDGSWDKSKTSEETKARIVELRKAGKGYGEIGLEVGLSKSTVWVECRKLGFIGGGKRGRKKTWQPGWTERAKEMLNEGKTFQEVGEEFGVSLTTVFVHTGRREKGLKEARSSRPKAEPVVKKVKVAVETVVAEPAEKRGKRLSPEEYMELTTSEKLRRRGELG